MSEQMAVKVAASTPPRKCQSATSAGDPEDGCLLKGSAKRSTRVWGLATVSVSLQSQCFSSFVLLVFVMFVVTIVSFTTRSGAAAKMPTLHPPLTTDFTVMTSTSNSGATEQVTAPPPPTASAVDGGGRGVEECDMSSGRWVYDEEGYPLYEENACRFMSENLACGKYGRTDLRYQHWRWQPHGCDLPRFDAASLLENLRGKRLVFVGDSLNRNQWVSMVCLIDTATPGLHKTLNSSGALFAFSIHEYNASVDFYWSPLLVESNSDNPVHHRVADRTVRANSIVEHARHWTDADVLVFNSYLWWRHPSIKVLWGSFETATAAEHEYTVSKAIDGLRAFELALTTWADWLEFLVDRARTSVFFMSMSPTHLPSDGDNHGCYNETEPIAAADEGRGHHGLNPAFGRAVEEQVKRLGARGVAVRVVNVTGMSERRRDAHPSVHRRQWDPLTEAQRRDPSSYADCIHWCLPGVPDVWNQLLYAHIV
ncbi:xylan O-acetyltransferase 14-like [Lolium perenne]|uniref:xylan O-acetyltransferase 14-like n=1 Tax=Lolium perenne TaxID=4522 RepID=UPI0021F643CF|nr:xylan O-acetyltransferase 14-like [Lolium perenne]